MGRCRIVEHIDQGQYMVVPLERDVELRTLRKLRDDLTAQVTAQEAVVSDREDDYKDEVDDLNALILAGGTHDEIQAQRYECNMAEADYAQALAELNALKLNLALAQKKYEELPVDEEEDVEPIEAWCADYSVFLTGEVDTIEIDGDTSKTVIIAPGGVAPVIPETIALTVPAHSATQAFYNWAIFPAWQRWMPTYREGIIEAMYQDPPDIGPYYAKVALVPSVSAAQGLTITPPTEELPERYTFDYMSCHYAAFTPGDRVIVAWPLRNWTEGVIIGFVSNPRPCDWHEQVMFRIGDMVSVYCPENDFVVLPPTPYMGPRYLEWYNRTISALNVESPYDTVSYVLPNVLTESVMMDYVDYSLDPRMPIRKWCKSLGSTPISAEVHIDDNDLDCHFTAEMNGFVHSPAGSIYADNVGTLAARPSPTSLGDTYAAYDVCKYYEVQGSPLAWVNVGWKEDSEASERYTWDYQHLGAYCLFMPRMPDWADYTWSLRMYNEEQGEITVRMDFDQTLAANYWQNWYDSVYGLTAETEWLLENTWTYYSIGGQSISGEGTYHQVYDYSTQTVRDASYDWITWGLRNTMRSGSTLVQSFIHETGHLNETLAGGYAQEDITVWVPATCDFVLYQAMETPGYNRSHNATFSAFLKTLYEAARVYHGYASNVPMNWMAMTREAGIYAYVPEEGLTYPYEIGEPDPEEEE